MDNLSQYIDWFRHSSVGGAAQPRRAGRPAPRHCRSHRGRRCTGGRGGADGRQRKTGKKGGFRQDCREKRREEAGTQPQAEKERRHRRLTGGRQRRPLDHLEQHRAQFLRPAAAFATASSATSTVNGSGIVLRRGREAAFVGGRLFSVLISTSDSDSDSDLARARLGDGVRASHVRSA